MSSVPDLAIAAQEPERDAVLRLARQLTPAQRRIVAFAGQPRWLCLPQPWYPTVQRIRQMARALTGPEYRLLEPVPHTLGAYRLTSRGERVAGVWLRRALHTVGA